MRSKVQTGGYYAAPESINSRANVSIPLVQLRRLKKHNREMLEKQKGRLVQSQPTHSTRKAERQYR